MIDPRPKNTYPKIDDWDYDTYLGYIESDQDVLKIGDYTSPYPWDRDIEDYVHRIIGFYEIFLHYTYKPGVTFFDFVVHHMDHNKENFKRENLAVVTPQAHANIHKMHLTYKGFIYAPNNLETIIRTYDGRFE